MIKKIRFLHTQAFRVFLLIAGVQAVFLGALAWAMINVYETDLREHVLVSGSQVTDLLIRSTQHSMLTNDKEEVKNILDAIGTEPGIEGIRIFNTEGKVVFATEASTVGRQLDLRSEPCALCHDHNGLVLPEAEHGRSHRIYAKPGGERVLSISTAIWNCRQCSDAACHAHPATRRVLGVMDTEMSLAAVDESFFRGRGQFLTFSLIAVLGVALVSGGFIWWSVRRPAKKLIAGMELASAGSLDWRLETRSRDELGQVARAFNAMMEDLARARKEITEWSATLEEKVNEKTADLERAHKRMVEVEKLASLGNLSASMAHEINNPLEGILTFAKLSVKKIQKLQLPPEATTSLCADLELVADEAHRCGAIVKNLLVFARQSPTSFRTSALSSIINRCVLLLKHYAETRNVKLRVRCTADDALTCDPGQIQQVLLVLMVNGIEAMSAKPAPVPSGELIVDATADPERDVLVVRVADIGVGIPEQIIGRIFEPFFTTKTEGKGVGLGLSIAFGIVQRHRGTIEVESAEGKGSVFTVTLPRSQPATDAAAFIIETPHEKE
jgi:two-component system, NtrC family, sensor kinase